MLILNARVNESIYLDTGVIITLTQATNGQAKIGITAPKSVNISREVLLTNEQVYKIEKLANLQNE
jgi:carbon storage regulator CsrA